MEVRQQSRAWWSINSIRRDLGRNENNENLYGV